MKIFKWLTGSVTGLMLVSCVTINIYFPAAAAEKAADRIIEDVWGSETAPKESSTPEDQSQFKQDQQNSMALAMLNWLISPAAAEANLNISSPAINAIQAKMKARHNSLSPHYASGAVGLTDKGLITIRDAKVIALKDRNTVKSLVADENKDRNALYAEIARANGHPEWQADIQATFARRWISNASSGWWYQSSGNWQQK
ncbi:MAG: YdbL family protein [Gammaproteobacteria bacterium]|nr:YdbL family protein [Gammaproteobacteria bacterium]MDH5592281.1 YdbL family protein [Gammaproteobacteria bacterium]